MEAITRTNAHDWRSDGETVWCHVCGTDYDDPTAVTCPATYSSCHVCDRTAAITLHVEHEARNGHDPNMLIAAWCVAHGGDLLDGYTITDLEDGTDYRKVEA